MILLLMLQKAQSIEFLKDKSNWLIIGNDGLADKFGVDNITMEDFVNGELEVSEGAKKQPGKRDKTY